MKLPKHFISCDWGTSNFRIKLVNSKNLQVLKELKTDVGVSNLYHDYSKQNRYTQEQYFIQYLLQQMDLLDPSVTEKKLVIASGMVTSSIGMRELEYAKTPIHLKNGNIVSKLISIRENVQLLLTSGIRTEDNVMRGEELQAMGLMSYLPNNSNGVLVLPGTHSKHIVVEDNKIQDFKTFMTGELFEILTKHSIISKSVLHADWASKFTGIFLEGVKKGKNEEYMSSLFSIRANDLIHNSSKEKSYYYLSGLLLGSELSYLQKINKPVFLSASGILFELYLLALTSFISADRLTCFEPDIIDKALLAGQKKIVESYA